MSRTNLDRRRSARPALRPPHRPAAGPRGFTLIEVVTVVLVVAALGLLAGYGYQKLSDRSRDQVAEVLLAKLAQQGVASHTRTADGPESKDGFTEDGRDFTAPFGEATTATVDGHTVSFPERGSLSPHEVSLVVADTDVHLTDQVALRRGDLVGLAMRSWTGRCVYAAASAAGDVQTWITDDPRPACHAHGALEPLGVVGWYGGDGDPDADGGTDAAGPDGTDGSDSSEPLTPEPASTDGSTAEPDPQVVPIADNTPGAQSNPDQTWSCDNPPDDGSALVLWARSWGVDDIASARVDATGALYVVGTYSEPVTIAGITLTPADESEAFVAKVNPDATVAWITPVGGPGLIDPAGIAVDKSGHAYLAAGYTGRVEVGGRGALAVDAWDILTARIGPAGHVDWIRSYGGAGTDLPHGLATDDGRLVLSGSYTGTPQLGGNRLPNRGGTDAFVAYVTADGAIDWIRSWGGPGRDVGGGVSRTTNGRLLITGTFDADTRWGATTIPRAGAADTTDILLATLDRDGDLDWAATVAGARRDAAPRASFDQAGFYYLTGVFSNTTRLQLAQLPGGRGGGTATFTTLASLTSAGGTDAFVAKFTKDGALSWAERFGGPDHDEAADFAGNHDTDGQDGDVYVVGTFRGTATFGSSGITLTADAGGDVFVAKISRTGGIVWVRAVGGSSLDLARVVTAGGRGQGSLYIASQYRGGTSYGDYELVADGDYDMVVARLDVC